VQLGQAFFRKALASNVPRVPRKVTLDGHVPSRRAVAAATWAPLPAEREGSHEQGPRQRHRAGPPSDQATLRVHGRIQVIRQRSHPARRHRTHPSDSEGTILLQAWPSAPRLVAESSMGDGARITVEKFENTSLRR
jgi:hypothetical protein